MPLIQKGNRFCSYSIKTYPFVHENKFSLISESQANKIMYDNVSHKKRPQGHSSSDLKGLLQAIQHI